jgi:hypothetical protein
MSPAAAGRAELVKLARLLDVPPERLGALAGVSPSALRKLREQIADTLFEADRTHFERVVAAARILPGPIAARLTERALGPLLGARAAALLEPGQAADLARRLSPEFLADLAVRLDPRHAGEQVSGLPPELVAEVSAELCRRREHVAMASFVGHLAEDALLATLAVLDDDALLGIGFLMEDTQRLRAIVALLPDERLAGLIALAEDEDRVDELLEVVGRLAKRQRLRAIKLAAAYGGNSVATRLAAA